VPRCTVVRGLVGGLHWSQKCLEEETTREIKCGGQGFEGVREGQHRHGWGGRVEGDRGKRCVQ
jgi:hypothetical protein